MKRTFKSVIFIINKPLAHKVPEVDETPTVYVTEELHTVTTTGLFRVYQQHKNAINKLSIHFEKAPWLFIGSGDIVGSAYL